MDGVVIDIAVDGDRLHSEAFAGTGDARGDFTAIGDQHLFEHEARSLPEGSFRSHRLTRIGAYSKAGRVVVLISRRNVPRSPIASPALRRRAERMLHALALARAELSILVCDDATIHDLNREHRRKDKPTDVLAFAMREGQQLGAGSELLGDVVISLETAARQAFEHRRSLSDEVTMLLAHGLLHLVGYDHRDDAEEREMNHQVARLCHVAARGGANVRPARVDKPGGGIVGSPPRRPRSSSRV
jgi:probable rRNA maturation factor